MSLVLIIDDSAFQRNAIRQILRNAGYDTMAAPDGQQGLNQIRTNRPDCVLADLLMPTMGGLELLEILRDEHLDIPVIILSAHLQVSIRTRCLEEGAAAVITKPVQPDHLLNTLAEVLSPTAASTSDLP